VCGTEIFFGKTLANANFMCYKRINFGKSPSPVAFLPKTAQFAHSNIDGVIKRNWWAGKCWVLGFMQARGDTGPLKKIQLHLAMNPSMAAFEAVKAARTPQLWGRLWVRVKYFPKKPKQHT